MQLYIAFALLLLCICSCTQAQIIVSHNTSTISTNIPALGFNMEAPFAVNVVDREVMWNWAASYFPLRLLRYPGGTISNFWDWTIGWGNQTLCKENQMPLTYYCEVKLNYTYQVFKKIIDYFPGSQGMWALNCETSDVAAQAAFLAEVSKDLPITFVELGNEIYNGVFDPQIRAVYPNSSSYSHAMNDWIKVISEQAPHSSFAVVGSVYIGGPPYLATWNSGVYNSTIARQFTLHWYLDDLPYCGSACSHVAEYMMPAWFEYTATRWAQIRDEIIPPWPRNSNIWFTEYNLFDYNSTTSKPGVLVGSWAHALLFAQQTFYIMSHPMTSFIMPHCFDTSLWAAFLNVSTPTKELYEASPWGTVFGEIMQGLHNASNFVQLTFSPQVYISGSPKTAALIGYQYYAGDTQDTSNINIVNLSNSTAGINVADCLPSMSWKITRCTIYGIAESKMFEQNIVESDLDVSSCSPTSDVSIPAYSFLALSATK